MEKYNYRIIALYINYCEMHDPTLKQVFNTDDINRKLIRAVEVTNEKNGEVSFYKIPLHSSHPRYTYIGFIVKSLNNIKNNEDEEGISRSVSFDAEEVTVDNIVDYPLESTDYLNFDKWIKDKNLDLYIELFEEVSNQVANMLNPFAADDAIITNPESYGLSDEDLLSGFEVEDEEEIEIIDKIFDLKENHHEKWLKAKAYLASL